MVNLHIDKKEIQEGLQMGIYTKEYKHRNQYPDKEDLDDNSGEEHTIYVYIDDKYNVNGVKSFFGESPSIEELEGTSSAGNVRIPVAVKEIPQRSDILGLLTQEEFKIVKICDGMNTIEQVAEIAGKKVLDIEKMMLKLHKKGLVDIIKRA